MLNSIFLHNWLMLTLMFGLHALAAVVHHHLQRDNTLTRMLPTRR